ncbi:uncharacterized protein LOC115730303 [Rhodamnia argentea]|uniref:Uncharacterized protein LOC115730303 n=1 Tax=Rhodamnia argentea TaxID=178133 RepID=A0A8B8N311_9MYRT|nr:uncharacterized protein LOC115730303 [Rhodamnia argentea]XP_030516800.1 uncharacterized protein LOC115730303 [Rhodamnia argentea]XP_030516801.1 uncharacterized protein LOC115730303 [Rhodamnia argentea]XP_048134602.1 uncharacterized protein LOC115730303 [Rhodamnia argentea]
MNGFVPERSTPWNVYDGPHSSTSPPAELDTEAPWKSLGASINAISFGFVATAILVAMFLIMAIFEHLFRPTTPSPSSSSEEHHVGEVSPEAGQLQKLVNQDQPMMTTSNASDYTVLMPGEFHPTHIAQPSPLPCPREGICWPPHEI